MTYHAGIGGLTGAFPSGRMDYESLPSGITPVSGSAPDILACLNFIANLDHTQITNGQALNLQDPQHPPLAGDKLAVTKFVDKVDGYMRKGGLQVQTNFIDRATLEDAKRAPDHNRQLLIRVSGYTAYFVDLNPTMQDEVIGRAEYKLL